MSPVAARTTSPPTAAQRRTQPGSRFWLATTGLLLAGTVGVGAGAGLGLRYAQKTGLSPTTAVGAGVLAAGFVSSALGVRRLWRRSSRWYRLLLAPLVVGLLLPASSVGLAVAYTQVPPTSLGAATPGDRSLAYTDVRLHTHDGVDLSGWLVPSRNGAAVVLLHGAGSTRTSTLPHAAVLAEHGYGVLMLDARGHGRSGGTGMDLGWFGDRDVAAAVAYLQQQAGIAPGRVGLVGLSMGGEQAIGAAVPTGVRAVVAEGATARTAADKDRWLPRGVSGTVQRALDAVTFAITDALTSAPKPVALHDAVQRAERTQFLLVTGGELPDETRAAAVLDAAAPARVDVWVVPGAGHTGGLDRDARGWEQRVVGFLDRNLA